ncbi:aldo/keto reductase [Modestobacter muralis]|uniref:Aldo/keto reductase n=1 Tax=Modestobacter muralis TaxID=1608614 RepID=A0A6P0HBS7_9ACTN|nr:aldo/keto reductase [Modestobacter muralis]NEK96381.1 aldo/keto reductase [Modestobacter muralis]NEN53281.1 aldo/keto reductase [Modestobacter muralis]
MPDDQHSSNGSPKDSGRRRFLIGAAVLSAAPLLTAAACSADADSPAASPTNPAATGSGGAAVATATTLTASRSLASLQVSSLGLGCQTMPGNLYGPVTSREDMVALVRTAADQGVRLFDTAEAYGPFESERIVGEGLAGVRDDVVIASKFGWAIDPDTGQRTGGLNSRPDSVRRAVEGMLQRLQTDRIDLLYQHRVDPAVPIEDVAGVVGELMAEGKVLHWGLSEPGLQTVRRAHSVQPLTAIQNEYSLLTRDPEAEVLPLCAELGIGFVPFSPLADGFTTGTMTPYTRFAADDFRAAVPRHSQENLAANMPVVQLLQDWSVRKGATPAQLSLAWLMAQQPWVVPIPSTTRLPHLLENLGAEDITFTDDELREFTAALDAIPIQGDRLPSAVLANSGVEAPAT